MRVLSLGKKNPRRGHRGKKKKVSILKRIKCREEESLGFLPQIQGRPSFGTWREATDILVSSIILASF